MSADWAQPVMCEHCGGIFTPTSRTQMYCPPMPGRDCNKAAYSARQRALACKVQGCPNGRHGRELCSTHNLARKQGREASRLNARTLTLAGVKKCGYCGTIKALDRFPPNPATASRRDTGCRECCNEKARAHHLTPKGQATSRRSWNLRRAREREALRIPYTSAQLIAHLETFDNRCVTCGGEYEALDHMVPLARGGVDGLLNYQPLCRFCNCSKGARLSGEHKAAQRRALKALGDSITPEDWARTA